MRNHTVAWLWRTPGRKKGYVAALTAVQVLTGFLNVGFALLLRNVINSAVSRDQESFRYYALLLLILTAGSLQRPTLFPHLISQARPRFGADGQREGLSAESLSLCPNTSRSVNYDQQNAAKGPRL